MMHTPTCPLCDYAFSVEQRAPYFKDMDCTPVQCPNCSKYFSMSSEVEVDFTCKPIYIHITNLFSSIQTYKQYVPNSEQFQREARAVIDLLLGSCSPEDIEKLKTEFGHTDTELTIGGSDV